MSQAALCLILSQRLRRHANAQVTARKGIFIIDSTDAQAKTVKMIHLKKDMDFKDFVLTQVPSAP
jgi:hypothetical protein